MFIDKHRTMVAFDSIHALAYFNLLNVLHILSENDPETVSANELKKKILVSNPDVTCLLDRLVKKGHVLRNTCTENRRKIDISLSDDGRDLFKSAHLSVNVALGNFFENQIILEEAIELRRISNKMRF